MPIESMARRASVTCLCGLVSVTASPSRSWCGMRPLTPWYKRPGWAFDSPIAAPRSLNDLALYFHTSESMRSVISSQNIPSETWASMSTTMKSSNFFFSTYCFACASASRVSVIWVMGASSRVSFLVAMVCFPPGNGILERVRRAYSAAAFAA